MSLARLWRKVRHSRGDKAVLQQELAEHLRALEDDYRGRGLSIEDARRQARLRLGNVTIVREDARAAYGFGALERIALDVRYALRSFAANPAFAGFVVAIIALGIGATTTMFSVVHGVLLRPLPFREPERLVMLEEKWLPRFPRFEASPLDYLSWREQARSFHDLAAFRTAAFTIAADDQPERVIGARVSANLPALLGVDPALGRTLRPDDDAYGRAPVALIGDGLWRRRFRADPGVIGTSVRLNGVNHTIVGVMPASFRFPERAEIWTPIQFAPQDLAGRGNHIVWAIGRLHTGVTPEQAQAEMDLIMPRLQGVWTASVIPLSDHYVADVRRALYVLLAAAGVVLLIAGVNVAGLLVARGASRQREIAMRAAIGASRGRIVQQLVTETSLLAAIGGALGIGLTYAAVGSIKALSLVGVPRLDDVSVSSAVIVFSLSISIATGLLFGLLPAWRLSRADLGDAIKTGGRTAGSGSRTRLRSTLVASEVALAVVLLAGAAFLLKSFSRLTSEHTGITAEHVLTAAINLPAVDYREPAEQQRFVQSLLQRLERVPDLRAAAVSTGLPFAAVSDSGIRFDGRPEGPLSGTPANHYRVTPEYFRVMQIPLRRGRLFTDGDTASSAPVVIINETMARRFFPDTDPIGTRLDIAGPTYMRAIIGVVGDVRQEGVRRPAGPQVYEAFAQKPSTAFRVTLRSAGDPMLLAEPLRQHVSAIDKGQPLSDVKTMDDVVGTTLMRDRLSAGLLGVFAGFALLLAAIGVYGVIAYSVAQRTQEIGVRLALGADAVGILRLVLGQTMGLVVGGLVVGLMASMAAAPLLQSLLYEISPRDPLTWIVVTTVLTLTAAAAAISPAFRAVRIHPAVALRAE